MSFSDLILVLALIGCAMILVKERKKNKLAKSRRLAKSSSRTRKPVEI